MASQLGELIYQGAETCVVAATHAASGEQVVLKLPAQSPPAPQTLEKLRREHAILSELAALGIIRAIALEPHE